MASLEVRSPFDNALIDTIAIDGEVELEQKLARAQALHARGDVLPKHERLAVLERAARAIEGRKEELARLAAQEGGKPLGDSRVEIGRAVEGLRTAQAVLHRAAGREVPMGLSAPTMGRFAHTLLEPLGLVGAISAFNHPFNLAVHQVIPAVATGCPVLIKPARKTPLSCRALIEILREAGLGEGRADSTVVGAELAARLARDARLRFFSFIGSADVGFELARHVAPGVPVALEHGGVAPLLLHESADFEAAVRGIVKGGYYHAGQVCVSVQRVFVPRARLDEFLEAFVPAVGALTTGDPLDESTEVGPLISAAEVARVAEWISEAVAGGGRLAAGGQRLSESLFEPTIVVDPPEHVRLSTQEVFGPVVVVYGYDDWASAIDRANAVDSEFQAALFARDLDVALASARRLRATAVMVNDHTAFRADWMPFGGRGRSGQGFGGIEDSMHDLWAQRLVVFRSPLL